MQDGVQNVVHVVFEVGAIVGAYIGGFYVAANGLSMLGGAGKAIGNMFNKAGGGLQGAIGNRKETNAFAIRRQLNKEAKKGQRIEAGASAITSGRGRAASYLSPSMLTRRGRARSQRVQTQASGYTADQQKQALGKINYQHAQALSMANGNIAEAAQILEDQGIDAGGLQHTANAVRQGGINLQNASTAQALGDIAAETGTLVAGYGQHYAQNVVGGRPGSYQRALAEGTQMQWTRTTRGKSNFAADERTGVARLGSFGNTAAADIDAILTRAARNQERLNRGESLNTNDDQQADARHAQDMERLARYTAKAELAREAGDKSIDEYRWRSIQAGRQAIRQQNPTFDAQVAAVRAELETTDRARAQF